MLNELSIESITKKINKVEYIINSMNRAVTCTITMKSSFIITSTYVSNNPLQLHVEIEYAKKCAYEKAFNKLWDYECYRFTDNNYTISITEDLF